MHDILKRANYEVVSVTLYKYEYLALYLSRFFPFSIMLLKQNAKMDGMPNKLLQV